MATLALLDSLPPQAAIEHGDEILGFLVNNARALGIYRLTAEHEPMELTPQRRAEVIGELVATIEVPRRKAAPSPLQRKLGWLGDTLAFTPLEREMIALFARTVSLRPWPQAARALRVSPAAAQSRPHRALL